MLVEDTSSPFVLGLGIEGPPFRLQRFHGLDSATLQGRGPSQKYAELVERVRFRDSDDEHAISIEVHDDGIMVGQPIFV
jgi:hypothetical protein